MTIIKRQAYIMSPGEYAYTEGKESKIIDDLREMAAVNLIYPITYGHPEDMVPDRDDVIGTWSAKWDEEAQKVRADTWFFKEKCEEELDPAIWQKIVNFEPVGVSPGYKYKTLTEEGAQLGILPNHLAIARPGENTRCPLDECGVNVRFDTYKYDQIFQLDFFRPDNVRADSEESEPVEEKAPEAVEAEPTPERPEEQEEPAEQKPEVQTDEAPEEVQREPEVIIPPSVSVPGGKNKDFVVRDDGYVEYVPRAYRTKEET